MKRNAINEPYNKISDLRFILDGPLATDGHIRKGWCNTLPVYIFGVAIIGLMSEFCKNNKNE